MTHRSVINALVGLIALVLSHAAAAAPTISFISPANGPTTGGPTIMIHGDGFTGLFGAFTPTAKLGGANVVIVEYSDHFIRAILPAGQGVGHSVMVTVQGETATLPNAFHYNPPSITSVTPNIGPVEGGNTVTIMGANFGFTPTVRVAGQPIAPAGSNHSSIQFPMPPAPGPGPATIDVVVAGQISNLALYHYDLFLPDPPVITNVIPSSSPTEGGGAILVMGQEFGDDPKVQIGGALATTLLSLPDMLLVAAPPGQGANAALTVENDGAVSSPVPFAYHAPVITGFSKVSPDGKLTIFGRNFGLSPLVTFDGLPALVESNGHHSITVTPPDVTPGTIQNVIVTVSGEQSPPVPYQHPTLPADLNGDGEVNGADLAMLLANWGIVK